MNITPTLTGMALYVVKWDNARIYKNENDAVLKYFRKYVPSVQLETLYKYTSKNEEEYNAN